MTQTLRTASALCLLGVLYWMALGLPFMTDHPADLNALWLAGLHFAEVDPALVYTGSEGVFTMAPPEEWIARTFEDGKKIALYPFIYPPLWAWAASHVTGWIDRETFFALATALNQVLLPLSFVLAWRILKPRMSLVVYLSIALVLVTGLIAFVLPLRNGQLQILVSFLILLAIERQRAGWNVLGGAALALAASIKLYPALFALLWLAAGQRRALLGFLGVGGALGLTSLAVAPWSFHAAMFQEYSAISSSYIITRMNYSFAPLIAALSLPPTEMVFVSTEATGGGTDWFAGVKPALLRAFEAGLMLATLAWLLLTARATKMRDPLHWAFAFFAISWVSPLSWVYHYMTFLVFLPILVERLGALKGGLLIAIGTVPLWVATRILLSQPVVGDLPWIVTSNAGLLALGAAFVLLAQRRQPARHGEATLVPGE